MYEFPVKGQINIYRFVPLDNTYTNTLHFENQEAQLAYFGCRNLDEPTAPTADTIMKLQYTNQTYTRNERQYIRIEGDPNMLYDCNYMAYQNRDFGEHWFFAFILSVEYINNYVAEVEFELDVMQSFMWNYALRECFVEREHCLKSDDVVGKNTLPEPTPDVPKHYSAILRTGMFNDFCYVVFTTYMIDDTTGQPSNVNRPYFRPINGILCSGDFYFTDNEFSFRSMLYNIEQAGGLDGIMGGFIFPKSFLPETTYVADNRDPVVKTYSLNAPTSVSGYTPKNKKLLNYPYTSLVVDSGTDEKIYRFEWFTDDIEFKLYSYINGSPMIKAVPQKYGRLKGDLLLISTDLSQSCVMNNFPIFGFPTSSYENWLTQNNPSLVTQAIGSAVLGFGTSALAGNPYSGFISAGKTALDYQTTLMRAEHQSATSRLNNGNVCDFGSQLIDFYFKIAQPTIEGAKAIDTFFSMYGYATNRVKIPNIVNYSTCRPNWNYIKATNCNFHWFNRPKGTSVPQKYMRKIISIFANGITFWKNPNNVGNYIDDNTGELNDN